MKTLALSLGLLVGMAAIGRCVVQPHSIGSVTMSTSTLTGTLAIYPVKAATMNTLIPGTTGQLIFCLDCVRSAICVSSGSVNAGSWVVAAETGTFNGSSLSGLGHCQ